MVASLGLAIAIRYSVQAVFGPRFLRYDFAIAPGMKIFGAFVTRQQLWILAIVSAGDSRLPPAAAIHDASARRCARPSTNRELAQASGVDTERVIAWVWFIGTGFAALGGALIAWDTQLVPELGFNLVIPVFCVVLIGGVGSVYGAHARRARGRLRAQFRRRDRSRAARQLARRRRAWPAACAFPPTTSRPSSTPPSSWSCCLRPERPAPTRDWTDGAAGWSSSPASPSTC